MPPLRQRLLTPRVARAITSPSAILLAGAGASIAVVAGLPAAVAVAIGAAAYAGRVALAVPRARTEPAIEPDRLTDPWRSFVREAMEARRRYAEAIRTAAPGPLRERLERIGQRIADGVEECWRIAQRGDALDKALTALQVERVRAELAAVQAAPPGAWTASGSRDQTLAALQAQVASHERLARVAGDARDRLRVLDARLDEAVARTVELALWADDARQLSGLGGDVDALVGEMETLRQALEETWAS